MYSIGEISKMFDLPISTLRYYDKEGLFPHLKRVNGVRKFSENEIETLRVIDCLKRSGLEIKDIKEYMNLCSLGNSTLKQRKEIFVKQKEEVLQEMEKLQTNLGGIKDMEEMPGVIFLVDPKKEYNAINEAKKLNIPTVGIVDTNCNPEVLDYAIPGNDDAIRAVKLITDVMANAVIEGKQGESFEESQDVASEEAETMEEVVAEVEE